MRMALRWALVVCVLWALPARAATYYVRLNGSDERCSGLSDAPLLGASTECAYQSIQKALDVAAIPGDIVLIHEGTYFESIFARSSGEPGREITIKGCAGETVVIDAGEKEFRTPGNSDWEPVDLSIGEYRSSGEHRGARVYGYIAGIPNYENGRAGLVPYVDTRAETPGGLAGFLAFRAVSDAYVDPATPFYVGPGLWLGKECRGGSGPAIPCERAADCTDNGTCAPTSRIHIRLSKTEAMRAAEARYGTVLGEEDADPRSYALILSLAFATMRVSGAYLRFENLTFDQSLRTINLEGGAHHLTFDGVTVWVGDAGIAAESPLDPPHDIVLTRSRIYGDSPYWIFWSDAKDAPFPALKTNGTDVHIANGSHGWEVSYNHIRGGMDGISTNTDERDISIHHNRLENMKDDSIEIEGTLDVGRIAVFENYIGNCLNGLAPGQQSPRFTGPVFFYRNVVALLRDHPVNRKAGLNMFNGGLRFGHEYAFKQHSPNTFYYHNTVVLLNSHDKGLNIVPGDAGEQADTYVFNNILVKVNHLVQGPYDSSPGQIVDHNLYWKMNTDDADPLVDLYDTVQALSLATGLEAHGIGAVPQRGTNPRFKTWAPIFDRSVPARWAMPPDQEVWSKGDFALAAGSPAMGAGRARPTHPRFGILPDSRNARSDLGAIPSIVPVSEWDIFPFDQGWRGPFAGADLVESAVMDPPASAALGGAFPITDTVSNQGAEASLATLTRYYLSSDARRGGEDLLLGGSRAVPALGPGEASRGTASVVLPRSLKPGSYHLLACADDTKQAAEGKDANNCSASEGLLLVTGPDLVQTAVSDPPPEIAAGDVLSVTDTVANQGSAASARGSTARVYLSLDAVRDEADRLLPGSARSVAALRAGEVSTGTRSVTLPAGTAAGSYLLLACADDTNLVAESDEGNNCAASSGRVRVLVRDLVVAAVSSPPPEAVAGNGASSFTITDRVRNQGEMAAPATTTRYYLSLDTLKNAGDIRLGAVRAVPALAAGESSSGTTTLTVPAAAREGTYTLLACADDTALVVEGSETNNCRAAAGALRVTIPDLVETALSDPPASLLLGQVFSVTDTVANQGSGPSKASTVRYYVSLDAARSPTDWLLPWTRVVARLAAGDVSTGTVMHSLPVSIPPGSYTLLACADDAAVVAESNDANNCLASAPFSLSAPDLVVAALDDPPAAIAPGRTFTFTDTVANQGTAPAGSSFTSFSLSLDALADGADVPLTGASLVPALRARTSYIKTVNQRVPASVAPGTYYLLACADSVGAGVTESDETNNCRASAGRTRVAPTDLVEGSVEAPGAAAAGSLLPVTDTVANEGITEATASATRYYLSLDASKDARDVLLSGIRLVPPLAPGASSTGSAMVRLALAAGGGYQHILACADDGGVNVESSESNNCAASAPILIQTKDLVEDSVSDPPLTAVAGNGSFRFPIMDTVTNRGELPAEGSTTRYYLSADTERDPADVRLSVTRAVPALAPGASSTGTVTAIVPSAAPEGAYHVLACADNTALVIEGNERNNCRASAGSVRVTVPDLVVTALNDPPATAPVGAVLSVTDSVRNQGSGTARSSATRYYLSLDPIRDAGDVPLAGSRAVPGLSVGSDSTGTAFATIPVTVPPGDYLLLACADDAGAMREISESNNCRASSSPVLVTVP